MASTTARNLAVAACPIVAVLFAGFVIDRDFFVAAPIPFLLAMTVGFVSYHRNQRGQWWLHALTAGVFGLVIGTALLFYIGTKI